MTHMPSTIRSYFKNAIWLILLVSMAACTPANLRVIKNSEINNWGGMQGRYQNLFPPRYGYLEETEYDGIDFLKPHERRPHKYKIHPDPRGDIDRTLGYDPLEFSVAPDLKLIQEPVYAVQITWLRHATFLIQLGGEHQILVDPVIEELDGVLGVLGKYAAIGTLYADSPLATEDIPFADGDGNFPPHKINTVAISHDHYDHLNYKTLKKLPPDTNYYIPLGLQSEFPSRFNNVTAMDWYTRDQLADLTITFLPANHRSGRSLSERDQNLWGGWLFESKGYRVYFAGDSGYSDLFKDIRRRYGEMDVCMMPITAWFQRHWHFAPEDAVQAAVDLGCKTFIPWGWGTWILGFEHMLEPPRRLQYAWDQMQPENMELRILRMGETYTLD
jgi:N-acyl-phosphatidylethanolamine-hydrolysing phospholipase D